MLIRVLQFQVSVRIMCLSMLCPTTPPSPLVRAEEQGGVTPIDSIVTAATAGESFDRLSSAV